MARGIYSDPTLGSGDQMCTRVSEAIAAALKREGRTITVKALQGFSSPTEALDEDLFELVVATHTQVSMKSFLAAFGHELDRQGATLPKYLGAALEVMPTLGGRLWNPALSLVYRSLEGRCSAPSVYVAARAALALGEAEVGGAWNVNFEQEVAGLRWANSVLPSATTLAVENDGRRVTIDIGGAQAGRFSFLRTGSTWTPTHNGRSMNTLVEPLSAIPLYDASSISCWERDDRQPLVSVASVSEEDTRAYADAVRLISCYLPSWIPWFTRALRAIAVVEPPGPNQMTSGSYFWSCGEIHISSYPNCFALAEAIVHETAHEYLHIATQIEPIDDGSDGKMYYSPVVRAQRTLDRVLLAYHAFANVTLFYRGLRDAGVPLEPQAERGAREAEAHVDALSLPLINNPALTAVGRGIFQPLAEKLSQTSPF